MRRAKANRPHFVDRLAERVAAPERPDEQLALVEDLGRKQGHGGRGTDFEKMIERAHSFYRRRGMAVVERNKRVWDYTTEGRARSLPAFMAARTLDGRNHLVMENSQVDYSGTAGGRSIRFDAKETAEASIPLRYLKADQVKELCDHELAGALAGFLIHFSRTGEVFWVKASQVRAAQDLVLFQVGKGRHPKSLSLEWMGEHALAVYTVRHAGDMCDYLSKLLKADE